MEKRATIVDGDKEVYLAKVLILDPKQSVGMDETGE